VQGVSWPVDAEEGLEVGEAGGWVLCVHACKDWRR